jgi:hypothetical protein
VRHAIVTQLGLVRIATLGSATWLLSACYSYMAAPSSQLRVGEHVRVRVSGAEAERLESTVNVSDRRIEGELLEQADSNIALGVTLPTSPSSSTLPEQLEQRVVIPRADLQDVELRRFDRFRTTLLVGGVAAGVVAIAAAKGSSLLGGSGATGSPNERRVPRQFPLVQVRVRVP